LGRAHSDHTSGQNSQNSFDVLAEWVQTLHGQGKVPSVLRNLMTLVKADVALINRFVEGSCKAKEVSAVDTFSGKTHAPAYSSFTQEILGDNLSYSQAGSVWFWSEFEEDETLIIRSRIGDRMRASGLCDVASIVLEVRIGVCDYLELQFRENLSRKDRSHLSLLAGTLSSSWKNRLPGSIEKQMARTRVQQTLDQSGFSTKPILHVANPSGLSRCEFRVCAMVKEGMLAKDIARALAVSEATVRSHLHAIYTKTNTSGQIELLHRLSVKQFEKRETAGDLKRVGVN